MATNIKILSYYVKNADNRENRCNFADSEKYAINKMARKKKELPLLEQIEITGVAAEGKALARVDDLVVFVPFVVPGDVVDLQVRRKKHSYAEAEAVKFHRYSPERDMPFCKHYVLCGGCKWQCLAYEYQLKYKQQQVVDALTRIGKVELPDEVTELFQPEK